MSASVNKLGRPFSDKVKKRTNGQVIPPTVAGQVNQDEYDKLETISQRTGQTRSQLVRRAVQRLIEQDKLDQVDFAIGLDAKK